MAEITYKAVRTALGGALANPFTDDDPKDGETQKETIVSGYVNIEIPTTPDIRSKEPDLAATLADFTDEFDNIGQVPNLGIEMRGEGTQEVATNIYNSSPQLILNAGRIIMNASTNFAMIFGDLGVILSSRLASIHLDAEKEVVLHGKDGVFIGLPGGDELKDPYKTKPTNKGNATVDNDYEPLVLGLKLVNWLDDLIQTLQQAQLLGLGDVYFNEITQENFRAIRARLPEMVSTYAFVDGISHEAPSPYTPTEGLKATVPPKFLSGKFISNNPIAPESDRTFNKTRDAQGPGAPPETKGFFEDIDDADPEKLTD